MSILGEERVLHLPVRRRVPFQCNLNEVCRACRGSTRWSRPGPPAARSAGVIHAQGREAQFRFCPYEARRAVSFPHHRGRDALLPPRRSVSLGACRCFHKKQFPDILVRAHAKSLLPAFVKEPQHRTVCAKGQASAFLACLDPLGKRLVLIGFIFGLRLTSHQGRCPDQDNQNGATALHPAVLALHSAQPLQNR